MDDPQARRLRLAGQFPLDLPCVRLAVLAGLIGFTIAARCMAGWSFALDLLLMQGVRHGSHYHRHDKPAKHLKNMQEHMKRMHERTRVTRIARAAQETSPWA